MRARTYDPEVGRFLSRDPVEGVFEFPESYHPYTWNNNNPGVYRDPLGMFTLVSVSVSFGVEDGLKASQSMAMGAMRQYLTDTARGIIGQMIASAFEGMLPAGPALEKISTAYSKGAKGDKFEEIFQGAFCDLLPDSVTRYLWLEPLVYKTSGRAATNGMRCGSEEEVDTGASWYPRPARPDFILSTIRPKKLTTGKEASSYLISDFKIGFKNAWHDVRTNDKQWVAMKNHARRYAIQPIVLYITWYDGTETTEKRMLAKAVKQKIALFVFSFSSSRR